MLCRISDLLVEVPDAGGMAPRCRDYLWNEADGADIIIRTDLLRPETMPDTPEELMVYLQTGFYFYTQLLNFDGMMLHASAVELDGKAYLFSGNCGAGKSTHTRLWQEVFGKRAQIFNDDKPALRLLDGQWFAYGTPWCGKDGINQNRRIPLAGICFLKKAQQNKIRRLPVQDAVVKIIGQTMNRFNKKETLEKMLALVDALVSKVPVYEMENRPEPEAAWLSYHTMAIKTGENAI